MVNKSRGTRLASVMVVVGVFFFKKIKNRSRWLYAELNSKYNHRDRFFENFPRFPQMAGSD